MTPEERNLFALAERLHMPVFMMQAMPYTEYRKWCTYFSEPAESKNLLNNPAGLVAAVGAFHGD